MIVDICCRGIVICSVPGSNFGSSFGVSCGGGSCGGSGVGGFGGVGGGVKFSSRG